MQAQTPSLLVYWRELAALLVANSALVLLVARLLFDDQVVKSLRRARPAVMDLWREWYRDRNTAIDTALQTIATHEDRMEAFESSLMQQGAALTRNIDEHNERQTKALEAITGTLGAIQKEAAQTALAVARMEGAMNAERRGAGL